MTAMTNPVEKERSITTSMSVEMVLESYLKVGHMGTQRLLNSSSRKKSSLQFNMSVALPIVENHKIVRFIVTPKRSGHFRAIAHPFDVFSTRKGYIDSDGGRGKTSSLTSVWVCWEWGGGVRFITGSGEAGRWGWGGGGGL